MKTDTIAAISTAVNTSGIGIIRISGEDSLTIADKIFRGKGVQKRLSEIPSHTIHYGYAYDRDEMIDEVLLMVMKAPRSYTTEDTVEINCHGGIYAMTRILEVVIKNGARPADPGEFTKRAFLNGRIDLSQAEAVMDVIEAKNEYALKSSLNQLKGSIRRAIGEIRKEIIYHVAAIESALDDPEHYSLDGFSEELQKRNQKWMEQIHNLICSSENGKVIKEGIKTVIVGKPNAGKSSLMNILVGEEKAIVTEIAGTTRDVLEDNIRIHGISLNIIDTAGIRETENVVEKIGVDRAKKNAETADLILYVVDSSTELDENDKEIIQFLQDKKSIVLLNKTDLPAVTSEQLLREKMAGKVVIPVSAKENKGIDILEDTLKKMFLQGRLSFNDEVYITNARHKAALIETKKSLEQVQNSILNHLPEDFYSIDLMNAYEELGNIIGESVNEDLVKEIFSKFCMGK